MIAIPFSPNRAKNSKKHSDHEPCLVCGKSMDKAINSGHAQYVAVNIHMEALTPEEVAATPEEEQQGCFPVGADCIRKHPELKPYLRNSEKLPGNGIPSGDYWMTPTQYIGL